MLAAHPGPDSSLTCSGSARRIPDRAMTRSWSPDRFNIRTGPGKRNASMAASSARGLLLTRGGRREQASLTASAAAEHESLVPAIANT
jgi:hypothetical protein